MSGDIYMQMGRDDDDDDNVLSSNLMGELKLHRT